MRYLNNEWYYFLADNLNRTCSWVNGNVVKNAIPTPLPQHPLGWKDIELKFGTNIKYWSLNRSFSTPLTFVNDGANILRWFAYNGKGSEEELYVLILHLSKTTGLYELEYRGKIDFSRMKDDPYRGFSVNTLEGGALRYLNANDSITYEIPCDGRNPDAIKVLLDGVNLLAKYNYSVPDVRIFDLDYALPLPLISSSGDSVDVITGSPSFEVINPDYTGYVVGYVKTSENYFFKTAVATKIKVTVNLVIYNYEDIPSRIYLGLYRTNGTDHHEYALAKGNIFFNLPPAPVHNVTPSVYTSPIPITIDDIYLAANERVFLISSHLDGKKVTDYKGTTVTVEVQSKKKSSTTWALRPVDSGKAIVEKMSNGLCTLKSNFLSINNRVVATCGDALRNIDPVNSGIDGYDLKTSFADWFGFYNSKYNLGLRVIDNVIWVEPKGDLYNTSQQIFDVGEASDFMIEMATEYMASSIKAGYPDQSYNGLSQNDGKLEFNSAQQWSLPITAVNKVYDISSKWNAGCYAIEFIRDTFTNSDQKYNESDNGVYAIEITDTPIDLATTVNNAIALTINSNPLAPIINSPGNNEYIYNNKPTIRGYAAPGANVGIMVDSTQVGYTTADSNGNWSYNIVAALSAYAVNSSGVVTSTGNHTISGGIADGSGVIPILAPLTTITVIIYTTISPFAVTSPASGDSLYNNKPKITGTAPAGSNVDVSIDGVVFTVVADGSCKWEYSATTPLSDGLHNLIVTNNGQTFSFTITISSTGLSFPLITSLEPGSVITDNTPLIQGVAKPGANVTLYLDFITIDPTPGPTFGNPVYLGQTVADSNGNWSFQVTTWLGLPINDGLHTFSTNPTLQAVSINLHGYGVYRDTYDAISGVYDASVFNVNLRPRNQILAHANVLAAITYQQLEAIIKLVSASKNKVLSTTKGGVVTKENDDIICGSLGNPLFLNYLLTLRVKIPYTFEKIMQSMQAGYLKCTVKGYTVYAIPIGTLSMKPAMEESQTMKLLAAPNNSLATFLLLSESVLFIQDYNNNMISISNLNPLHFFKFDFTLDPKYQEPDMFDRGFFERHKTFLSKPFYFQPWQKTDSINLQIITANTGVLTVKMYDVNAKQISSTDMSFGTNPRVRTPYDLQELNIPLTDVAEGEYKMIVFAGTSPLAESEWFSVQESIPGTVLMEYASSYDLLNGYFGSWQPMIRVQGVLMPAKPDSDFTTYEDELKDVELLHAIPSLIVPFVCGQPFGVPDWMSSKINEILLLNRCNIEGIHFTRASDSKFEETNFNGYPMSYFKTMLRKAINNSSLVIDDTTIPGPIGGIIASLDGETWGQAGNVIQITIDKE